MEDLSRHDLKLLSSPTSRVFQLWPNYLNGVRLTMH